MDTSLLAAPWLADVVADAEDAVLISLRVRAESLPFPKANGLVLEVDSEILFEVVVCVSVLLPKSGFAMAAAGDAL